MARRRSPSELNPAGHFWTWKTWAPNTLISFSMVDCTTDIAVITAMMEATPATIPTKVRTDLSLFLTIAPKDMVNASRRCMARSPAMGAIHTGAPR